MLVGPNASIVSREDGYSCLEVHARGYDMRWIEVYTIPVHNESDIQPVYILPEIFSDHILWSKVPGNAIKLCGGINISRFEQKCELGAYELVYNFTSENSELRKVNSAEFVEGCTVLKPKESI